MKAEFRRKVEELTGRRWFSGRRKHTTSWIGLVLCALQPIAAFAGDVLTYHNDNNRTGQNLTEEVLTPANVTSAHFGKLWVYAADGKVDAEPLYAAGVTIPGKGMHNVVYVVTEHDSVYAYDADSTTLFWQVSMVGSGETTSDARSCNQVTAEIGITSTPVIDRQLGPNGTLFVVAMTKNSSGAYFQRLHALDLATGADLHTPANITASYPSSSGTVVFDPAQYKERTGLLLLNGVIYTAWASHCDDTPYTGWVIGYDEHTLAQTSVLNITPNGRQGAIWMAGAGLAADSSSNIVFLVGNGTFDTTLDSRGFPTQGDYGNAFMKVSTSGGTLSVADYFASYRTPSENSSDTDLGSGGALVLPDMVDAQGRTRHLAVGAGKDQVIYLVDLANMGHFNASNDNAIYQELTSSLSSSGVYSMPAYFNGTLYYGGAGDRIRAFPFQNARLGSVSSMTSLAFGYPGATPSISANGVNNGILWATENGSPAVLHAYAATNLAVQLYSSTQASGGRDQFGTGNKYITPMIASGRVYVGTTTGVGVLGLLDTSSLTPLQAWRNSHFGNPSNVGAGANGASPAGDGVPNLVKYALGLNPSSKVTAGQLPTGSIVLSGDVNYLTLTVHRTAIAPDVTYTVEVSDDLFNWNTGPDYMTVVADTPTQLVVRDNVPVTALPQHMIRLVVSSP